MKPKTKGPWSAKQRARFLDEARVPVRLGCNGVSGHPVLASLWFVPEDGHLWCATQRDASVVRLLERDARCAYEVSLESPPYRGVRGTALAEIHAERGGEVLHRLIDRYGIDRSSEFAGFLLSRVDTEVAISVTPQTCVSWDFSERMGSAVGP
jgi:hypothetical protein